MGTEADAVDTGAAGFADRPVDLGERHLVEDVLTTDGGVGGLRVVCVSARSRQPLGGIGVAIFREGQMLLPKQWRFSNADGMVAFAEVAAGRWFVTTIQAEGMEPCMILAGKPTTRTIEVQGDVACRLLVTGALGQAIVGASIWLITARGEAAIGETAADGAFVANGLKPGSLLRVRARGHRSSQPLPISRGGIDPVMVKLSPGGADLCVRTFLENGQVAAQAAAALVRVDTESRPVGEHMVINTDEHGEAWFSGLDNGMHQLVGAWGATHLALERVACTIDMGACAVLVLRTCGAATCEVLDEAGSAVSGACVSSLVEGQLWSMVNTDGAGRAEVGRLPAGVIALVATTTDCSSERIPVIIHAGAVSRASLVVKRL